MEMSREEYKILFENVPAFIAVVNPKYIIVQANQNFRNTFGGGVGVPCYQAYKGLGEKCPECLAEKTFLEGRPQVSEEHGRTKEGKAIPYLVYTAPVFNKKGKIPYVIEMSVDLSEKKRLEGELRASQDFLNNLIENSIDGIIAVNASGQVIICNRSAERILGYAASEVIGSHDLERFFPRSFSQKMLTVLRRKVQKDALKTVAQEAWLQSKSGERIPVRFSGIALSQEESIVGAVGFFHDLRPFKILERGKLQAERLAVAGQTMAGLAHGVKTIITGLEGGMFVVRTAMNRQDPSLMEKGWGMVERNIEKISAFIKDLLSYSKERVPNLQWIHPHELVEEVCSLFQEKARLGRIQIIQEFDPRSGLAYLDPKGIHACLTNLLSNAVDACLEDKRKDHYRAVVRIRRERDGSVTFEVEDNGRGMTEEVRNKLFSGFFSTKGTAGTGLGLLVTHKIVHEHGGNISVQSQIDQGSLFRITIPQGEHPPREEYSDVIGHDPMIQ